MVIVSDPGDKAVRAIHSKRKNRPYTQPREGIAGVRAKKKMKRTRTAYSKRGKIMKERK
jgi:hypothetical protein